MLKSKFTLFLLNLFFSTLGTVCAIGVYFLWGTGRQHLSQSNGVLLFCKELFRAIYEMITESIRYGHIEVMIMALIFFSNFFLFKWILTIQLNTRRLNLNSVLTIGAIIVIVISLVYGTLYPFLFYMFMPLTYFFI